MNKTGKLFAASVLTGFFALSLVGCGSSNKSNSETTKAAAAAKQLNDTKVDPNAPKLAEGKSDSFEVVLNKVEEGKDNAGNNCVILTYTFTNKSGKLSSFYSLVMEQLSQGKDDLESTDSAQDNRGEMDEIGNDKSLKVVKSFQLTGDGPVDIKLFAAGHEDKPVLTYTYKK